MSTTDKDSFLQLCRVVHKYRYLYHYNECTKQNMVMTCPYHGKVSVPSNRHKQGTGCLKCLKEPMKTYRNFLKRASQVHGKEYMYDANMTYFNPNGKVRVKCKHHGIILTSANAHLNGSGCKFCAKGMLSKSQWVKLCNTKHKKFYDYTRVKEGIVSGKVEIRCPSHGIFRQDSAAHHQGSGCMDCVYDSRNPGKKTFEIYLFLCSKGNKHFYKPGLANDTKRRMGEHRRALNSTWSLKHLKTFVCPIKWGAFSTEAFILNNIPGTTISSKIFKVGHTETKVNNLNQKQMMVLIEKLIKSYRRKSKTHVSAGQRIKS